MHINIICDVPGQCCRVGLAWLHVSSVLLSKLTVCTCNQPPCACQLETLHVCGTRCWVPCNAWLSTVSSQQNQQAADTDHTLTCCWQGCDRVGVCQVGNFNSCIYSPTHVQCINFRADFDTRHCGGTGTVAFLPITTVLPQCFINAFPLPWSYLRQPRITVVATNVSSSKLTLL